jgi:cysteine desulfurase / selenocysteine lyase
MTLTELLADGPLRQHEFPVTGAKVFLAHAGVCPIPRRVAEAIRNYALSSTLGDQETLVPALQLRQTRELAARLLHASAEDIALVGPTSLALSFVAGGLSWRRGDNLVVYFDDYPANVYPWMALAARGVTVRFLHAREYGCVRPADVMEQVDEQTRLVALASCHFVAGFRPDIQAIGKYLRARGVLFCVDAIQTLGAFPMNVEFIDFLAADAHKWLLGPCAAGLLYVRKEVQAAMRPVVQGWHNVKCPNFVAQEQIEWQPDARRYEAGSANLLGLVGLRAALELIEELGVDDIAAELQRKRAWFVPAVRAKGFQVLSADARPENAGGIMSLYRDGLDMPALHRRLEASQVITSLRTDRQGRHYLRLSPHFYNTDAELQRVLELLPQA